MQMIGSAPADQKKAIGRYANELKQAIEARWTAYEEQSRDARPPAGAVDVTLPGRAPRLGHRHPLTIVRDRVQGQERGWELRTWPDDELVCSGPAETADAMAGLFQRPQVEAAIREGLAVDPKTLPRRPRARARSRSSAGPAKASATASPTSSRPKGRRW